MKNRLALFWEMFKISLFVVGGGFAILAVADDRFSRKLKWTKEGEIVSHLPVFQMVPGIIAGSTAIYVGRKIAGVSGAACMVSPSIYRNAPAGRTGSSASSRFARAHSSSVFG